VTNEHTMILMCPNFFVSFSAPYKKGIELIVPTVTVIPENRQNVKIRTLKHGSLLIFIKYVDT